MSLLALALATALPAAPPSLEVPAEVRPAGQYARLSPKTDAESVLYVGLDGADPLPTELLRDPKLFVIDARGLPAGRYRFAAVAAGKTGEQARADFVLVVGVPPNPVPSSNPFGTADGLRVLVVYEKTNSAKLTRDQLNAIYGQEFYAYLNARCPRGPGDKATWRIWDKDTQAAGDEDPAWARAMARPRQSLPWVLVGSGAAGFEGPLPTTRADIMALLQKYGG